MTKEELKKLLNELRALPAETECVEFKEAKNTCHFSEIGKYFSALSNEANLKNKNCGWLIFGIEDKSRKIVTGDQTNYVKYRAFDNKYYKDLIVLFLKEKGSATREEIDSLLMDKLSDALSAKQKSNKIHNLLYEMYSKDKTIKNSGSRKKSNWILI